MTTNTEDKTKGQQSINEMNWPSKEETEKTGTSDKKPKRKKQVNKNLSPEQMRELLVKYEEEHPDDDLEPFIVKSTNKGGNRFYITKAITMEETDKIDELFAVFQEEELEKEKQKAKEEYKKSNNIKEDIPTEKQEELDSFIRNYLDLGAARLISRVNDKVVNIIGVVFPDSYKDRVMNNKVPAGDIQNLSMAIQVLSGWSSVSTDIDVYEQQEDKYDDGLEDNAQAPNIEDQVY